MFKNEYLPSHAFWLCQHGVKNVYVQSYKFLKRDKWKWGTLNKAILDMITRAGSIPKLFDSDSMIRK